MLSSGMKRYHLELMFSSGTTCYHLGLHVIIWDTMLSSGANVIIWGKMLSSGANVIMVSSGANVIIWCYHTHVEWRANTTNRVVVPAPQAGNRFLGSLKGLQIRALAELFLELILPQAILNSTQSFFAGIKFG
jgi:hypothetical protein